MPVSIVSKIRPGARIIRLVPLRAIRIRIRCARLAVRNGAPNNRTGGETAKSGRAVPVISFPVAVTPMPSAMVTPATVPVTILNGLNVGQ